MAESGREELGGRSVDDNTSAFAATSPSVRSASPSISQEKTWVGLIANKNSGIGTGAKRVRLLAHELARRGFSSKIAWTPEERHALVAQANADPTCRCLVAVGGDGTISALINEQPLVPVTVLPAGTENLAAQHFKLKRNPAWLARTIAAGHRVRADLGCVDGRRFLLMMGFGFDGDVVTRHHSSRVTSTGAIKRTHRAAYVEPILRASLFYRFPVVHVRVLDEGAEETLKGTTVFVFNLPRYALGLPFAPEAKQDDGFLDLIVFREPGPFQALYYLWRVLRGTHLEHPGVFHRRVRKVFLTSDETVPVQVDGDPGGHLLPSPQDNTAGGTSSNPSDRHHSTSAGSHHHSQGWTIEVLPNAIDVIVPAPAGKSEHRGSARQNQPLTVK
jgi:diacylglycerol kinase (ATP)